MGLGQRPARVGSPDPLAAPACVCTCPRGAWPGLPVATALLVMGGNWEVEDGLEMAGQGSFRTCKNPVRFTTVQGWHGSKNCCYYLQPIPFCVCCWGIALESTCALCLPPVRPCHRFAVATVEVARCVGAMHGIQLSSLNSQVVSHLIPYSQLPFPARTHTLKSHISEIELKT